MKKIYKIIGLIILFLLVLFGVSTYPKLDLITGFSAKSAASCYFIAQRNITQIQAEDNNIKLVNLAENKVIETPKTAFSTLFGFNERKAIYREGLGVTLISNDFDLSKPYLVPKRSKPNLDVPFPYGNAKPKDTIFTNINYKKLRFTIENAFDKKGENNKKTRSVIVIYKDKIIAEKYANGINQNSKLLGWSMTKSITATYFGILQKQGKINIYLPAPVKEWQKDKRKNITIHHLLQMNSGLAWEEDYTKISDVTKMLFQEKDMTVSQIKNHLIASPNHNWNYSSGTTNLLSGILRKQFKTHQEYLDFWYSSLIDKIGMNSAILETDMCGNYVGSSYCWATTRDWAKFGLLYLHKGNWNGEQLFDTSWAKYVATPTNTSNGGYGAHFWLNAGRKFSKTPKDMYYASGYQGQKIAIFPSNDLVIVRMGLTEDFDFDGLYQGVIESIL